MESKSFIKLLDKINHDGSIWGDALSFSTEFLTIRRFKCRKYSKKLDVNAFLVERLQSILLIPEMLTETRRGVEGLLRQHKPIVAQNVTSYANMTYSGTTQKMGHGTMTFTGPKPPKELLFSPVWIGTLIKEVATGQKEKDVALFAGLSNLVYS